MFNATTMGRMYNGKIHEWKRNNEDREMFRGRLNYRDPQSGDYHWIDAVCFADYGENGGLVGFLGENFTKDGGAEEGRSIVLTGYPRPTQKQKTVKVTFNSPSKGKVQKDVPNVPYETFEFVILSAYFPARSQNASSNGSGSADMGDFDEEDFDDVQIEPTIEDGNKESEKKTSSRSAGKNTKSDAKKTEKEKKDKKASSSKSSKGKSTTKKAATTKGAPDDEDFFDEEAS
ncbi:hypothetical protein ACK8P5_25980 (plasmid) [Paenibacillus sp. EC2-1]|uniref:hypothetical protein n=1 Tax=Paenibacillus sp. EC2-1 TaxID=3388665 RepID=UPI003BEEE6AA